MTMHALLLTLVLQSATAAPAVDRRFTVRSPAEAVATIAAGCARCDWSAAGREAVLLEIRVDGKYSQHLALTRGDAVVGYPVMLGSLSAGEHHLQISRDARRSAAGAGA